MAMGMTGRTVSAVIGLVTIGALAGCGRRASKHTEHHHLDGSPDDHDRGTTHDGDDDDHGCPLHDGSPDDHHQVCGLRPAGGLLAGALDFLVQYIDTGVLHSERYVTGMPGRERTSDQSSPVRSPQGHTVSSAITYVRGRLHPRTAASYTQRRRRHACGSGLSEQCLGTLVPRTPGATGNRRHGVAVQPVGHPDQTVPSLNPTRASCRRHSLQRHRSSTARRTTSNGTEFDRPGV